MLVKKIVLYFCFNKYNKFVIYNFQSHIFLVKCNKKCLKLNNLSNIVLTKNMKSYKEIKFFKQIIYFFTSVNNYFTPKNIIQYYVHS